VTGGAWYNEIDPYAAQWLRNLIDAGHIAPGVVDERSIIDVRADELAGFVQCHFFAGIGGWSLALRLAGWPDARPVWTGSCPCQPFSAAGQRRGFADERHLWPAWFRLIGECRPGRLYGEQVADATALRWWDAVRADLEHARYACAAADLCAAGVGAPHIRQRLYWLADDYGSGRTRVGWDGQGRVAQRGPACWLADDDDDGCEELGRARLFDGERTAQRHDPDGCDTAGLLGDAGDEGLAQCLGFPGIPGGAGGNDAGQTAVGTGVHVDFWTPCDWIDCQDGKRRPIESGTFPLAAGLPAGMGRLRAIQRRLAGVAGVAGLDAASLRRAKGCRIGSVRAYGNAIVPPLAAVFIRATT
jgi:DNA (cytosine-5)-methyltransferase 1